MLTKLLESHGLISKEPGAGIRVSAHMAELPNVPRVNWDDKQNVEVYKQLSWVYIAVRAIARNAAMIPMKAMKTQANGEEVELINDQRIKALRRPFPPFMSNRFLKEWTYTSLLLTGKAYWEVQPSVTNPQMIFPLHPELTKPIQSKTKFVDGYNLFNPISGQSTKIPTRNVVWMRFVNPSDDYEGLSPLRAGSLSAATDITATKMNLGLLFNQARPSGILRTEAGLSKIAWERLKEQFQEAHSGPWKAGKPLILQEGLDYKAIGLPPKDMEYLKGRMFTRDEILAIYGVPPTIAGIKAANFATAQVEARQFYEQAISPIVMTVAEAIDSFMFPAEEVELKGDFSNVMALQEDGKEKEERLKARWDRGVITTNEYRQEIDKDPLDNGDVRYVGSSVKPLDEDGKPEKGVSPFDAPGDGNRETEDEEDDESEEEDRSFDGLIKKAGRLFTQIEREQRVELWKAMDERRIREETRFARDASRLFRFQKSRVVNLFAKFAFANPGALVPVDQIFDSALEDKEMRDGILVPHVRGYLVGIREGESRVNGSKQTPEELEVFGDFDVQDEAARQFLSERSFFFADRVNHTTKELLRFNLQQGFDNGENTTKLQQRVSRVFDGTIRATAPRSLTIARTEVGIVQSAGIEQGYKNLGVGVEEWLSSKDEIVRPGHRIDGERKKIHERFSNGLRHPLDPEGDAGNIINCRCTSLPVVPGR